jgi:hypothetical protein
MTDQEVPKHSFKITSSVGNWRKSFSLALGVPTGFLPIMNSNGNVHLSIVNEPSFLLISFKIIQDDNHPDHVTMYEKRLSPYMFKEILRRMEISMMVDSEQIISSD